MLGSLWLCIKPVLSLPTELFYIKVGMPRLSVASHCIPLNEWLCTRGSLGRLCRELFFSLCAIQSENDKGIHLALMNFRIFLTDFIIKFEREKFQHNFG